MKKGYYILGLAGALLYASSSLAGVAFIEHDGSSAAEKRALSGGLNFEDNCNRSKFNRTSEMDNASCESCLGNSGMVYSCTCNIGFELNTVSGTCEPTVCDGYTISQNSVNDRSGTYDCKKCGNETKCKCTAPKDGYVLANGVCELARCNEQEYPLTSAPGRSCTEPRHCKSGDESFFGCKGCAEGYKLSASQQCIVATEAETSSPAQQVIVVETTTPSTTTPSTTATISTASSTTSANSEPVVFVSSFEVHYGEPMAMSATSAGPQKTTSASPATTTTWKCFDGSTHKEKTGCSCNSWSSTLATGCTSFDYCQDTSNASHIVYSSCKK